MRSIFYGCSAILCILWAIGFFLFHAGMFIHVLIAIALLSAILSITGTKELAQ